MKQITPLELLEKIVTGADFYLIDVREAFEHEEYNIGGKLMPLGEVISHASAIPTDKSVIVYCRKGIRSQIAIQRLQEKFGFTNLINLQGGIEHLKNQSDFDSLGRYAS